jgi:hypothetical protein
MLKKTVRYLLRLVVWILCLGTLVWGLLAGYILLNKPALLKKARTALNDRIGGEARIGDIELSFFRHFPHITIHLSNVDLRDSLWKQHHHDLLQVEKIDIRFALFKSILSGSPQVGKIFLEQGTIYLFTDSTGYSNTSLLHVGKSNTPPGSPSQEAVFPDISLTNIKWVLERQDRHKLFDLNISELDCSVNKKDRALLLRINTSIQVNSFSFKTEKGSFLKDKTISGRFALQFNIQSNVLQATGVSLRIGGVPFLLTGRFFPTITPDPFSLTIETERIPYRLATSLLTPDLRRKMDAYDIDKPISLHAIMDAGAADDPIPRITVRMDLDKGSVAAPIGRFTETSFQGLFSNEWMHGHKREDENSVVRLFSFSGHWQNILLKADTITIANLRHPFIACDLHSGFDLTRINELSGSKTIQFRKGSGSLNVIYKGPLSAKDTSRASVNGTLDLDTATVKYLPYGFQLTDCNGRIRFKDQDLLVDHLEAHAGNSKILLKGMAKNLVSLIDRNDENVSLNWILASPRLDLRDLAALAGKPSLEPGSREPSSTKTGKMVFATAASRIDRLLKDGTIHLQLEAADLSYKKFSGAHAKAELLFSGNGIKLSDMRIDQGGGSLTLNGVLTRRQDGAGNPVSIHSHMEQVDLPKIFTSFNNFGQQALQDKNLKGVLTADIDMTGLLNDKAEMVENSLKGTVLFSIKGGQLLNFEPMEKIHETALKNRDLSGIRFAELKNQLDLDTTTLAIHRMEIQSTAITLFVEGTYDLKTGADLSLQVPLSNLKERSQEREPQNRGTDTKTGLSLRLRAKTGADGKLKISWDPFKKALKKGKK